MSGFGVVSLAVDDYPVPPGPLPSSDSAAAFVRLLGADRGGTLLASVVATGEGDVVDAVRRWAEDTERPMSSVVYFVGHGRGDGLDHDFLVPDGERVVSFRTARLAEYLQRDWQFRQADPASWTLVVLDCCDSELGVTNVAAVLADRYPKKPRRLGLWPVAPGGASRTGAFVAAFERALGTFTENDERIPLDEVFRRIRHELGDLEPAGFLPDEAALARPGPAAQVVMTLDVHEELRRAIADRPNEIRSHFLAKAQGSEVGEVAWHFTGREREIGELCEWTHAGPALKVVTGEAGSGKSALLGHLVVLADPLLVSLYADSGLAPHLADGPRPRDAAFDAVVHLTGKTALEAVEHLASQIGLAVAGDGGHALRDRVDAFARAMRERRPLGATVLVDALDESQDPEAVALFLREMAAEGLLRVLVGTRRSLTEGPDRPAGSVQRELLDALAVDDAELLVVERDRDAVRAYAALRLGREGSPYLGRPDLMATVADRIAGLDQPFLFARLATAELLARPAMEPDDPELDALLGHGHRGVFAAALERIVAANPAAFDMVRALAHARGRGMPRTGGIWVDAARAIGGSQASADDWEESTMALADAYVTLDAEAGQSTYRLAHQTFVEHFHAAGDYGAGHRAIAAALARRHRRDGWAAANFYAVRYLPEHLVADADRTPPDAAGLLALVTDAGWLVRAVEVLGVDRTVEVVAAARQVATAGGGAGAEDDEAPGVVDVVERSLRRSRIALAREPAQLPGQVHARLKDDARPALASLGSRCGKIVGRPWLRMVEGALDWQADLETTYGLTGKLRGLGFGEVDDRPVVAVAVDHRVVLWDPRQGVPDEAGAIDLGDHRATAVAVATVRGRPVIVTTATYEGATEVWDARTGARLVGAAVPLGHTLAVGRIGERLVIAGAVIGEAALLDAVTLETVEPIGELRRRFVQAFAVHEGRLVALCVAPGAPRHEPPSGTSVVAIAVVDAATGEELWRSIDLETPGTGVDVAAGGDVESAFVVVAGVGRRTYWLTKGNGHIEEPAHAAKLRSLAVGSIGGRPIVASAPDYDGTALVELCQVEQQDTADGVTLFRPRVAGGLWTSPDEFARVSVPPELVPPAWNRRPDSFAVERPEEWPHTAVAASELDGRPVVVTGSLEGAVWVWDMGGGRPLAVAGPFVTVSDFALRFGWRGLGVKPPIATADSIALGHHPERGPIVAVACDGQVRLWTVPSGEPIETGAGAATVVDAVALGRVGSRDVLVTGSKGGVLGVWGLAPAERVAVLTLDDRITDVRVRLDSAVLALAGGRAFAVELVEP